MEKSILNLVKTTKSLPVALGLVSAGLRCGLVTVLCRYVISFTRLWRESEGADVAEI